MAPTQMTALMGDSVGTVGAAMPAAAAGPGGADTAAMMSAGAALQGKNTMLAMAANPLVMPNGAAVTGQMTTTAAGTPSIPVPLGVPGETTCADGQGARLTDMATPHSTHRTSDNAVWVVARCPLCRRRALVQRWAVLPPSPVRACHVRDGVGCQRWRFILGTVSGWTGRRCIIVPSRLRGVSLVRRARHGVGGRHCAARDCE